MDRERKKGTTDLMVLSLLSERRRHGYEIAKLIEERSDGAIALNVASLYPLLYRLQKKGLVEGRWVEKPGERRRRFYTLTDRGRDFLGEERRRWEEFVEAVGRVTRGPQPSGGAGR